MKIVSIKCPSCNAVTEVSTDKDYCYCPYCGTMSYINDGTRRVENNKNININKNICTRNENLDYARVMEAKIKGKIAEEETKRAVSEKRWLYISMTVFIIGLFVMCIFLIVYESSDDKKKEVQKQALMSSAEAAN